MEKVNHPDHYGGDTPYEVIKVLEAWNLGFHLGNAVKYIARAGKKDPELVDLKKALWYIEREISRKSATKPGTLQGAVKDIEIAKERFEKALGIQSAFDEIKPEIPKGYRISELVKGAPFDEPIEVETPGFIQGPKGERVYLKPMGEASIVGTQSGDWVICPIPIPMPLDPKALQASFRVVGLSKRMDFIKPKEVKIQVPMGLILKLIEDYRELNGDEEAKYVAGVDLAKGPEYDPKGEKAQVLVLNTGSWAISRDPIRCPVGGEPDLEHAVMLADGSPGVIKSSQVQRSIFLKTLKLMINHWDNSMGIVGTH